MPRHSTKQERPWQDTEELPAVLADQLSDLIASRIAKPTVIVLQSRPGRGKTYVVQRLFDILAERDTTGFWRPGLTPPSVPTDEEALRESRKRITDPTLRDIDQKPDWFWFGLSATHGQGASTSGDSVLAELIWQVQSAIKLLRARRYASAAGRAASIVSGAALELGFEKYGALKTTFNALKQLVELYSTDLTKPADIDNDLLALIQNALRKALSELTVLKCTSIVVLDDAHLVRSPMLHGLAGALVHGNVSADQGRTYFDTAAPASDRRLIIVATSWSRPHGPEFWHWMDEVRLTGVQCLTYREDDGWFSGFALERATKMFGDLASNISLRTAGRIVDRAAIDGRIAPILLMRYIVETFDREFHDDEGVDEFIASLPTTVEDIAAQRYTRLQKPAKDAVLLAGALGYEFPLHALRLTLGRRIGGKAGGVIQQLIEERYLFVDPLEELSLISSCRFADELDFGYARTKSAQSRWVKSPFRGGIEDWFAEFLDHFWRDLENERPALAYTDLREAATSLAREYLASIPADPGDVWNVCSALVNPSDELVAQEEPSTFAQIFAWSLRHNRGVSKTLVPGNILRRAHELAPRSRVTAALAIRVVRRRRDLSSDNDQLALSILRSTAGYLPSASLLAKLYLEEGRREEAKKVLAAVAQEPAAAARLASLYIADGQREQAKMVLESVGFEAGAAVRLASLYVEEGKRDEAIKILLPFADRSMSAIRLADLYVENQQREEAKKVLALVAGDSNAQMRLAELHVEDGDREAAKAVLAAVQEDARVQMRLAELYVEDGQRQEAKKVLASVADESMAAMRLADLHLADGQRAEAKNVLAAIDRNSNAQVRLAGLYVEDGQRKEAKEVLRGVVDDPMATVKLSELCIEDGEREDAKKALEPLTHERNSARKLASLCAYDGDFETAITVLEPHINADPIAALMMARYATDPTKVAMAQNAVAAHIKVRRQFMFSKMTEHLRSADDIFRSIPEQSSHLETYWHYLYRHGVNEPRAAGLYALLTARSFPAAIASAVPLVRPFVLADPFCAYAMSQLQLAPTDAACLRDALKTHAEAGQKSALSALAQLSIRDNDRSDRELITTLISQQVEFTDTERELYAKLLGLQFRKVREHNDPRGTHGLWELVREPQNE